MNDHNKVLIGKEDWLFLQNDSNSIQKQIAGQIKLDKYAWRTILENRKNKLNSIGIKYIFMVIPNKECVYEQFLPDGIAISRNRPIFDMLEIFPELIYPIEELKKYKNTYDKGDAHWNWYGAYIAYQNLISKIEIAPLEEKNISFYEDDRIETDLASKLGISNGKTININVNKNTPVKTFDNKIKNTGRMYELENNNIDSTTILFFGDSFGHNLAKLLSYSCKKIVYKQQPDLDFELIDKIKPNIVISEQIERFITRVPLI